MNCPYIIPDIYFLPILVPAVILSFVGLCKEIAYVIHVKTRTQGKASWHRSAMQLGRRAASVRASPVIEPAG
jgi:hypothetical protein